MWDPGLAGARRRDGRQALIIALAALLMLSSTTSALAGPAARKTKVSYQYLVDVNPREFTVCVGESRQIVSRLQRQVISPVIGKPRDMSGAVVTASARNGNGDIAPPEAPVMRLMYANGARSPGHGALFTYTRTKPGLDTLDFHFPISAYAVSAVAKDCKYKVSITSRWTVPGPDVQHFATLSIKDVILTPEGGAGGLYAEAEAKATVIRTGQCGGYASMSDGHVTIFGMVTKTGLVKFDVTYSAGDHVGAEGCHGMSKSGSQRPQLLHIKVDTSSGSRRYFLNLPQTLQGDPTVTGTAEIEFTVIDS